MTIKTFKEMSNILMKKGFVKSSQNRITGEEYDTWTKEKFIDFIDNCHVICINNHATIPELEFKGVYEIIKETEKSYYIDTKTNFGIQPYMKKRFLKIIK